MLDEGRVDYALRRLIADLDYDIHKYIECDEETGEDNYAYWVEQFIDHYDESL